ncbi:ExeA family protein [Rheinheimera maricola]|uniref:AAA family ATPase n=1 Tax=Rheinheimera maricola TaxID=2793282 RepID=A0ABS7X9E8_9GAMM|nr:AAA family ATPase [Rheinheimera maricola]MBZ9612173.1 AAA family ATPase [Rheinheimera maricola]
MAKTNEHKQVVIERDWKIRFGRMLANKGLSQALVVDWIRDHCNVQISTATLNLIIKHSQWPKKKQEDIHNALQRFAVENGLVSATQAHLIFLDDPSEKAITAGAQWRALFKARDYQEQFEEDLNGRVLTQLPEPEMLTQQTKKFFGLFNDPFENEIYGMDQVYLSQSHRYAVEHMLQAARMGSMLCIYAECGAGKTTIRRVFNEKVNAEYPEVRIIEPARIDRREIGANTISEAIMRELQITKRPRSSEDRDAIIRKVLTDSYKAGNRHVLVVDEAHDLPDEVIKQLKRIWELADGFTKFIGIILIGQNEMEKKLKNHFIREFTYRATQLVIEPLGNELRDYVALKLKSAHKNPAELLTDDAYTAMQTLLTGTRRFGANTGRADEMVDMSYPLNVNTLMKNALNLAASLGEAKISGELVMQIRRGA